MHLACLSILSIQNELKPREDNGSDQVSSLDEAIVEESVHV